MHKDKINFIFVDADNFLYRGVFDIGKRIYGEIYWRVKGSVALDDGTATPDEADVARGSAFYLETTGLPEPAHVDALLRHLAAEGHPPPGPRSDYQAYLERRFAQLAEDHIRIMDGTQPFLDFVQERRHEGYDIRLHIISLALEPVVEMSTRLLRIRHHFDGITGSLWDDPPDTTKDETIVRIAGAAGNRFVAMGGDAASDMQAARSATQRGVATRSFATPTGEHTAAQLRAAGAEIVVPDLSQAPKIFAALAQPQDACREGGLP